ncbi:carbohydrate porin [Herbaspirillum chlorophenolicum]|uniref:carbohydrate porin n=1 Tax=Herbaspirillum chlorophenolicum TaxID=211589 RepID=UPI00067A897D|nr:carbohydrate porin [Herbaspirillum chlorophenolicum]
MMKKYLIAALLPMPMLAIAADDTAEETWNLKGQATYIWQRKSPFSAAYTGPNSLRTQAEKSYSFSGTLFFGYRLAAGTELYFNPEVVQSAPMSDLTGLGGMLNSEQQKASGPNPTFYRARLFLRQTWNLGGETTRQESQANQLAGNLSAQRVVLTVGNYAVTDIFDNNAYAHDGRTQFMNWSLLTHGAYDYAADTRGYTWGAAMEYYDGDWVYRFGRYLMPIESNGQQLDTRIFRHFSDQAELEYSYTLGGQPGKLRLMAFHNRMISGSFRDALAAAGSGTPSVADVRKEQSKYGAGINVEQNLTSDIGMFLRTSWNDGKTETYSFTEVERSVTVGMSMAGTRWGRADDVLGIAGIRNGLSQAHRDYLAAGGTGVFIGDGRLNYRPEDIVEAYYNVRVSKAATLGLDVQKIFHPAYNADRGPVLVAGARLHVEF